MFKITWRPRGTIADERGENLNDPVAVDYRVPRDALQRIDTAHADVDSRTAELVDRAGQAIGDLAFLAHLDLAQRQPHTKRRAAQDC
jgi:hypothetical protein